MRTRRRVLLELAGAAIAGGTATWLYRDGPGDGRAVARAYGGPLLWTATCALTSAKEFGPATGGRLFLVEHQYASARRRTYTALSCLDTATGRRLWSTAISTSGSDVPRPAVIGATVVVRTGEALLALDAAGGAIRWRRDRRASVGGLEPVSPIAGAGLAYDIGEDVFPTALTVGEAMHAVDPATGRPRWVWRGGQETFGGRPAFAGDTMFAGRVGPLDLGRSEAVVYAVNTANGVVRWRRSLGKVERLDDMVTLYDRGTVYVLAAGRVLVALDAATGRPRWRLRFTRPLPGTAVPLVAGKLVYVWSGDGVLRAFSAATGRRAWEFATGDSGFSESRAGPFAGGGLVYVHPAETVYAIGADGRLRWKHPGSYGGSTGSIMAGGLVHVPGSEAITAHDPYRGTVLRRLSVGSRALAVAEMVTDGTRVYALSGRSLLALTAAV